MRTDAINIFTGNPLPFKSDYVKSITHGDTFYLIGGRNISQSYGSSYLETIYRYEPDTDGWTLLQSRLSSPQYGVEAFPVGHMEFPDC